VQLRRASRGGLAGFAVRAALALALGSLLLAWAGRAWAAAAAPAESRRGMVASPQADATRVGAAVLAAGGNAVDAAVATAFALAVTDPHHSGIGGGGFALLRLADGRVIALDARETAPAAATRDMFVAPGVAPDASRAGALAVGTPGLLAGLALALERWGTLSLAEALAPAIGLAEQGFVVGPRHAAALRVWQQLGLAERFPETARIQLPAEGTPLRPGSRLVQRDLARSLRLVAAQGASAFYEGELARAIVAEVQKRGGVLSLEDLAGYAPRLREPIRGTYRGLEVLSFPPPSSGGVALVEALNVLEGFDLAARGAGSSAAIHLVADAMKLAFADRAAWLGDPDFVAVPVAGLVSKAYAAGLAERLRPAWWSRPPWRWGQGERALRVEAAGEPPRDAGTTHLSVMDAAGNAAALTQTVNLLFGSGITVPGTGIVLNDEMDDFAVAPDVPNAFGLVDVRGANAVAPGKRPLSSMTPTVVLKEGRPLLVSGSPGGPRIISTTLLTLLNVVDFGMDVQEAVAAPRFHHQWLPDELVVEPGTPRDVVEALQERGHRVVVSERTWASAQAVHFDAASGLFFGGSDPRSDGLALGPP
jgi:gamma-glutamyltranspeptidase/glutathione hydrolase